MGLTNNAARPNSLAAFCSVENLSIFEDTFSTNHQIYDMIIL